MITNVTHSVNQKMAMGPQNKSEVTEMDVIRRQQYNDGLNNREKDMKRQVNIV